MGICSGISTNWLFIHCFQIELKLGQLQSHTDKQVTIILGIRVNKY